MRTELQAACIKLGIASTPNDADWQLAVRIIKRWNGSKLSEDEAKVILAIIVAYVSFPDLVLQTCVVGRAEELASEVFPELANIDAHMDYFAWWLIRYRREKPQQ